MLHRKHVDSSIDIIGLFLFGQDEGPSILETVRGRGLPLADDWDCLKSNVSFRIRLLLMSSSIALYCSFQTPTNSNLECGLTNQVRLFEAHCGSLTQYGMKHMRAFANICNSGISRARMEEACMVACGGRDFAKCSPLNKGYSA